MKVTAPALNQTVVAMKQSPGLLRSKPGEFTDRVFRFAK
jgi:hypothetical protein